MERDFYQTLRKIQKEERSKSTLARVGNDFYKKMYSYIKDLEHSIQNNPFSNEEHNLLKNSQIVATEICQLRENKINEFAVRNIQRSYFLFTKGKPQFDLVDTTPLNLTDEEENLYFALMDTLKSHRSRISLDKFAEKESNGFVVDSQDDDGFDDFSSSSSEEIEPINYPDNGDAAVAVDFNEDSTDENLTIFSADDDEDNLIEERPPILGANIESSKESSDVIQNDELDKKSHSTAITDRLNQIKNAKIVTDEKYEPIEKQINNQSNLSGFGSKSNFSSGSKLGSSSGSDLGIGSSKSHSGSDLGFSKSKSSSGSDLGSSNSGSSKSQSNLNSSFAGSKPKPASSKDSFNMANLYGDNQFVDLEAMDNDIEQENYNQLNADLDRINADLDKLSSQVPRRKKDDIEKTTILVYKDVNSIMGVDEKVYGPFSPQDLVILPKINAEILIKNDKARLVDVN